MPNGEQRPSTQLLGFMAPSSRILINYLIVVLKKWKGKEGKEGTLEANSGVLALESVKVIT